MGEHTVSATQLSLKQPLKSFLKVITLKMSKFIMYLAKCILLESTFTDSQVEIFSKTMTITLLLIAYQAMHTLLTHLFMT